MVYLARKSYQKAMIVGAQLCREVRSDLFESEQSFEHTFDTAIEHCEFVEGITKTMFLRAYFELAFLLYFFF